MIETDIINSIVVSLIGRIAILVIINDVHEVQNGPNCLCR
jgi:hypothetical protein